MSRKSKLTANIETTTSFLSDGLGHPVPFRTARDMLVPANGSSVDITIALRYEDGTSAPGIKVSAENRPETLTGNEWRSIGGLIQRWPPGSAAKLRERIDQGLVRLQTKLDKTVGVTNGNGQVTFNCLSWHVCGNESAPASDRITLSWPGGSEDSIIRCGIPLTALPNDASKGVVTKPGISGSFCQEVVTNILLAAGDAWKRTAHKPQGMPDYFTVTESSFRWGGLIPPHLTHRFGGTIDVRPISTDGDPTSVEAGNYSREGTSIFINYLRQSGATEIRFADNLSGVTVVDGSHRDHIHVSWLQNPTEPWFVPSPASMHILSM